MQSIQNFKKLPSEEESQSGPPRLGVGVACSFPYFFFTIPEMCFPLEKFYLLAF